MEEEIELAQGVEEDRLVGVEWLFTPGCDSITPAFFH